MLHPLADEDGLAFLRRRLDVRLSFSPDACDLLRAANAAALDALATVAAKKGGTTAGVRCSGEPFLSDRCSDTLMSPEQLSRPTPFAVEWPRETGAHTDFPYLRRKIDRGASLDASQNRDVWRANEACLDALAPLLTGDGLPGVEEGEARRLLGRAMAEQRMVATTTPADLDRYASVAAPPGRRGYASLDDEIRCRRCSACRDAYPATAVRHECPDREKGARDKHV